jgi:hypothetical protein
VPRGVGLFELFFAVLIVGVSGVNAGVAVAAWARARDGRLLLLTAANVMVAVLGAIWTWGQLPLNPPSYAEAQLPVLAIALVATLFLLATTLWPRHA